MELREGQVAVVTGGGSGIGLALAERFAAAGLDLMLADVQEDALAEAAALVGRHGHRVETMRVDVSKQAEVQALVDATIERFGAVHVVCNNAGVGGAGDPWFGPIESWEWVMGVNFWGVVYGCRAFLPHLIGGGHIVNTASIAGLMPGFAPPYDASKHAVVAVSEGLHHAMKMAGLPVGVSVLCPGWVNTKIIDSDRNYPAEFGPPPEADAAAEVSRALRAPSDRRGCAADRGRRRRARCGASRPVLGDPASGLPRHRHRPLGHDRRASGPDPAREPAGHAAPLADRGRGDDRPRAGLSRPARWIRPERAGSNVQNGPFRLAGSP